MSKSLISLALAFTLAACDNDDTPDISAPAAQAVVQTVSYDNGSSEVVAVDIENQQVSTGYYTKDGTDYTLLAYGDAVYHLGRINIDTVTKYSAASLESQIWSYSTQDSEDSTTRNLYTLAFASESQAYVIRYGSDKIWIVNPEAQSAEDFKIGELDLSAYVENNDFNTPRASTAVVHNGKLFVAMQRLDTNWATQTAYVAVFDVATGEEIETNANSEDNLKGIPLTGLNPLENSFTIYNDTLYVSTNDSYSSVDRANSKIESINTNTYELNTVLNATAIDATVAASIQMTAIVNEQIGYFTTTRAVTVYPDPYTEASTLYEFNPSTGEITNSNIADTGAEDINFIVLDDSNFLWLSVGSTTAPGIDIIDILTNDKYTDRLLTDLNPQSIAFIK